MSKIVLRIKQEPVLVYDVILTAVGLAIAFGVPLTAAQAGALVAFVASVLGVVVRQRVRPIDKLRDRPDDDVEIVHPAPRRRL